MTNGVEGVASGPKVGAARRARVAIPFLIVTLIWSSTWLVIHEQLGIVPPVWSITYRFGIALAAMMAYALATGAPLRLTAAQHGLAIVYGIAQYSGNYVFVYLAEQVVTSGLVAVIFALLIVPNALLAWFFLRQPVSRPFLIGSAVAMLGMALLSAHEIRYSAASPHAIAAGIAFSVIGVLFASVANVLQATDRARQVPVVSLVAWGMAWGTLFDALLAFAVSGPPVFDPHIGYWLCVAYLGLIGSALAFTLYFGVVRAIGPARAAYSSVLIPALAMLLSTIFEGYRWSIAAALGGLLSLVGLAFALWAKAARPAR